MNGDLSEKDLEIYQKIDDILYNEWNPIGLTDLPRNEYENYTSKILKLKKSGGGIDKIVKVLFQLETDKIGTSGDIEHCRIIAAKISLI
jgi:hypothetical protein